MEWVFSKHRLWWQLGGACGGEVRESGLEWVEQWRVWQDWTPGRLITVHIPSSKVLAPARDTRDLAPGRRRI